MSRAACIISQTCVFNPGDRNEEREGWQQASRQAGTAGGGIQGVKNLVMFLVPVVTVLHSNYVIYRVLVVGNLYS
jgi:hypothetical protein